MNMKAKQSTSLWTTTKVMPRGAKLLENTEADVCVVGAGIAGMTTAYLLAREGKRVVVVDKGPIGGGETSRSTAHLSSAIDDRYVNIERVHGEKGAALVAQSHSAAIDLIEKICREEAIECHFRRLDGYLFSPDGESPELLDRELEAAHRAGITDVKLLMRLPVAGLSHGPCLQFPRQGQINPLQYLAGLATAFLERGGRIYSGAHVLEVHGGTNAKVVTKGGQDILADAVVVATNSPINDRFVIHTKQEAYRTYVVGLRIPADSVPTALYWDTLDPYHYIRVHHENNERFLLVGGEDHRTGQSGDEHQCLAALESWARERFPQAGERAFHWSGQIEETADGLAYIGRNPLDKDNVYIATGDSGMGMTHGTIAGRLLTDLICGRENPWTKLYDPARRSLGSVKDWVVGNLNTVTQYADYLTWGEVDSQDEIAPGEGAIVRRGLHKLAVYRGKNGIAHELSATCPHLGGIVRWNTEEKTWDCPCHGSRFSALGKVLNGPAISGLERVEEDKREQKKSEVQAASSLLA